MDDLGQRLIWIVGSSRSGSTWLTKMLAAHDDVVAIDDPHIGHHLSVWRPISLAWGTARELPELKTLGAVKRHQDDYFFSDRYREAWAPALRELIVARFAAQVADAAGTGVRPRVVVKDPGASGVAELIGELFPESSLVFLLRDGRDVVDSWLDAYREGAWGVGEGTYPLAPEGRLAFLRWQASVWLYRTEAVERAYRAHDPARRRLVRYEELRGSPEAVLAGLFRDLEIPASAERAREIAAEHSFEEVPESDRGEGERIRRAEPGSWRRDLSPAERAAVDQIMGPKLRELGYEAGRRARYPRAA
ncbi:MAG TPA: sulfotransferase [Solirubrobacterales bacterium]